ncbi:MarR family transcriptional regulator [Vibrio sp. JC009]|uniref:MarR family winged helix-turn-helix transcriptional regulator n=1 Tax=Vibrio sp. JC009 TaxID=2912314 RepID=UPI0023AF35D2|nr:MarR family transcriptional regulator [Vibrio sp. JC009]WED23367.1 MarR family transcriptional regulator [Vibrio sp. JC009]
MENSYTSDCPLYLTGVADKHLREALAKRVREQGLNVSHQQIHLLLYLFQEDGISQKRLSELTKMTKISIVKAINLLEANNLAVRIPRSDDQRNKDVYLTPEGKRIKETIYRTIDAHRASVFEGISPEEAEAFKVTLKKMLKNTIG